MDLDLYDTDLPPEPPSFEPWLGRVRMARSWFAGVALVTVTGVSYTNGLELSDAVLRGMVCAVVGYFIAWGSALWLASELYFAQVGRIRRRLEDRERQRAETIKDLYRRRIESEERAEGIQSPMENRPAA